MDDLLAHIDGAIAELDRARRMLGKARTRQVRSAEQRDFLKATSLSWFRSHRPALVRDISSTVIEEIDQAFRQILGATDRAAAPSTYLNAIKTAKAGLGDARNDALDPQPSIATADVPPSFGALASDIRMQEILTRRWQECTACLESGAPLSATVMMGGLLEALFVSRANKMSTKDPLFRAKATPIDRKTKRPLDLRFWTLAPYIDVGHELGWISPSAKDVAAVLRGYRNYIHPEKERAHGITLTHDDAKMLWEVTKSLTRELLAMKGKT